MFADAAPQTLLRHGDAGLIGFVADTGDAASLWIVPFRLLQVRGKGHRLMKPFGLALVRKTRRPILE
jgi:hypothetical protein